MSDTPDDAAGPGADELDVLVEVLGVSRAQALDLLDACRWADHAWAVRTYGYPKDNALPPSMRDRLSDRRWLADALEIAQEEAPPAAAAALRRRLEELDRG